MATSLQTGTNTRRIRVTTGNLFAIAARELGDATQWNRIAQINGMRDPFFVGERELLIPPKLPSGGNGGLLGV